MSEHQICPECGCPRENNESVCEECGYRFVEETATQPTSSQPAPQEPHQSFTGDNNEFDFNESPCRYSPFKSDSWFFRAPVILRNYPVGAFNEKHPFLGWLLGALYITPNTGNRQSFNAINNFFLLLNLIFKAVLYSILWLVMKMWVAIVAIIALTFISNSMMREYDTAEFGRIIFYVNMALIIASYILGIIVYGCGVCEIFRRYWPRIYSTAYRMTKRFCLTNRHALQNNSLDA